MCYIHKVAKIHYLAKMDCFFVHVCVLQKNFLLLTAVKKSNEFFFSYDHKYNATFFIKHSVEMVDR